MSSDESVRAEPKRAVEDAILKSLKAEESKVDKLESREPHAASLFKKSAGAELHAAFSKYAQALAKERNMSTKDVMRSVLKEAVLSPNEIAKALYSEVVEYMRFEAGGNVEQGSPISDKQAAEGHYCAAQEKLKAERLEDKPSVDFPVRPFSTESTGPKDTNKVIVRQPCNLDRENETLAMIRAVAEQLMIEEIDSHTSNIPGSRGIDTRIMKGSRAAKAQGAFTKYATAIAVERGLSPGEVESMAKFYHPVPPVDIVVARIRQDAMDHQAVEASAQKVVEGGTASALQSAADKLAGAAEHESTQSFNEVTRGQLLQGNEPLFVLGVDDETEDATIAYLNAAAAYRKSLLDLVTTPYKEKSPTSVSEAESAVTHYVRGIASLREVSTEKLLPQNQMGRREDIEEKISMEEILNNLRHQAAVLFVEQRRAGTRRVEPNTPAGLVQSAVDHFARSIRLAEYENKNFAVMPKMHVRNPKKWANLPPSELAAPKVDTKPEEKIDTKPKEKTSMSNVPEPDSRPQSAATESIRETGSTKGQEHKEE